MKYTETIEKCLKEIDKADPRLQDWQKTFAQVQDPRRKQGQRFTLTSILLLALAAILCKHVSELAIAQWGGHHPVFCVLAELSQEGNLRGEYMHRRLLLPFSLKTRRKPMPVP